MARFSTLPLLVIYLPSCCRKVPALEGVLHRRDGVNEVPEKALLEQVQSKVAKSQAVASQEMAT